jgi:uncharacterized protein (DUF1501 family)
VASVAELDSYGLLTNLSRVQRQAALEVFSCMYDDGWDDQGLPAVPTRQTQGPVGEVLRYMGQTGLDAQKGAAILRTAVETYNSPVSYPKTSIGQSLRGVAQVKLADLGTRVFYTAHGSFDTHATQMAGHAQLWRDISEAIAAFFADLRAHNAADDMIMLLWSEFGRRVRDNGSGTDHGAGGMAFVLGDAVKGGMYGEYPSLSVGDLTLGNLTYTNDFRSTYSTILERWFDVEAKPIVNGAFEQFAFV